MAIGRAATGNLSKLAARQLNHAASFIRQKLSFPVHHQPPGFLSLRLPVPNFGAAASIKHLRAALGGSLLPESALDGNEPAVLGHVGKLDIPDELRNFEFSLLRNLSGAQVVEPT